MLLEVIFLVLSAVVLTVVGVGMVGSKTYRSLTELGNAPVIEVEQLRGPDGRPLSGHYDSFQNKIFITKKIPSSTGEPYELSAYEKEFVIYHEKFHEVASKNKYLTHAEKENYADLAAIYGLIIDIDQLAEFATKLDSTGNKKYAEKVAFAAIEKERALYEGIKYLHKTGRVSAVGNEETIDTLVKYLSGDELDAAETDRIQRGFMKTKNLLSSGEQMGKHAVPLEHMNYNMGLKPWYEGGKSVFKKATGVIRDIYNQSQVIDANFKAHKFSAEHGYPKTSDILNGFKNPVETYVFNPIYDIFGLGGGSAGGSSAPKKSHG